MAQRLPLDEFLPECAYRTLLDVRTPAEYADGHIPGAVNLPLFSNEERVEVGTLYKQVGPERAFERGLELVAGKMTGYVREALTLAPQKRVAVYCWRGGKRSASFSWLLGMAGFDAITLQGGYKSFRTYFRQKIENEPLKLFVLGGKTGSGKTEILQHLRKSGEQVIDLEGLAHHKGSAFGWLGESNQPSVEHFENLLYRELSRLDWSKRIWIENESRRIGTVVIPDGFWKLKIHAPLIHLEVDLEERIERLIRDYGGFSKEELLLSFSKIQKRLGGLAYQEAVKAIHEGAVERAVRIGLQYYDKTYLHCVDRSNFQTIIQFPCSLHNLDQLSSGIIRAADAFQATNKSNSIHENH